MAGCGKIAGADMIIIFDMFETVIDNVTIDFNVGLLSLWEKYYQDKCSFDEIKAYGKELFGYMMELHGKGRELVVLPQERFRICSMITA